MHVDVDKKNARRVEERGGVQQTTSYVVFHEQLVGIVGRLTRQLVNSTGTRNSQSLDKRLLVWRYDHLPWDLCIIPVSSRYPGFLLWETLK